MKGTVSKRHPRQQAETPPGLSPRPLGALVGLGVLNAVWAVFLWGELLVARAGGTTFCGVSEAVDCTALWDGAFAAAVQGFTRIPVAGWGTIWALGATALPLLALVRLQEGTAARSLAAASRIYALAGAAAVTVLLVVSFLDGGLCIGCVGTYLLVAAYVVVAFRGLRGAPLPLGSGAVPAVMALGIATLVLIYPGIRTPQSERAASRAALDAAIDRHPSGSSHDGNPGSAAAGSDSTATSNARTPRTLGPAAEAELIRFVDSLPPQLQQSLSDSLHEYRGASAAALPAARAVYGALDSAIRIDEWTDVRCGHCAELHATIERISAALPPGSFSVVPHHFPLDSACNPNVQRSAPEPVSCVAAAAQICLEADARLFEFSKALFEVQRTLTVEQVYALAEPYTDRATLEACVASPATQRKLDEDIRSALAHGIEGTPLVLVNGRRGSGHGPFLYAMVLGGGSSEHAAFAGLPAPNPDPHAGHNH